MIEDTDILEKAKKVIKGILQAHSPRQSDIAREMSGSEAANYKYIQRFLQQSDPESILQRLFQEKAEFVIGDPTEMPRAQARKTEYVGKLSDGKTSGYWLFRAFLKSRNEGKSSVRLSGKKSTRVW